MTAQLRRAPHLPETIVDWPAKAACKGRANLFFGSDPLSERLAIAICARCPVLDACTTEARTEPKRLRYGTRAGATQIERRSWPE
jgi:hypothetical protein